MATIATLFVKLGLDTSAYSAGLAKAANTSASFASNLGAKSIAAGKALSLGFTAPILAAGIGSIKAAADFEKTTVAFTTMLGSAEDAKSLLAELAEFGVKTPFTLPEVEKGAKGLLAYGIEADKILPTMKALGDVSAGLNVPIERMILNFGQVKAQGKLTGRELRDFAILGVPLISELSKSLGVAESEITAMVSAGEIGFPEVEAAFLAMSGEGGKFQDLMAEMNKTTAGQFAEMKDEIIILARAIGLELLPIANDVIAWVKDMVGQFTAMSPEQQKQILMWAGIVAAIGPALIIFGAIANVIGFVLGIFSAVAAVISGPLLLGIAAIILIVLVLKRVWEENFAKIMQIFLFWKEQVLALIAAFSLAAQGDWAGFGEALRVIWDAIWVKMKVSMIIGWIKIKVWFNNAIADLKEKFGGDNWVETGGNIIRGIIDGVQGMKDALGEAIVRMVKNAWEAVKAFLGETSPSKLFAKTGMNMARGIGVGFKKAMPEVSANITGSMSGVASVGNTADSADPFSNALAGLRRDIQALGPQIIDAVLKDQG